MIGRKFSNILSAKTESVRVASPVVLFNETAAERAQEPGTAELTVYRKAE